MRCLEAAADLPAEVNRAVDIAGPQVLTYREHVHVFAKATGLRRRRILALPVLTPGLASQWVGAVTPVPASLARPLVASLVHPFARSRDDDSLLGPSGTIGVEEAIDAAVARAPADTGPRNLVRFGSAVTACAVLGSIATQPDSRWYRGLDTPAWQPPRVAFPIAWTVLYAVLGAVSAQHATALDCTGEREEAAAYRRAFGANLVLNAGWSALFFRVRRLRLASLEAGLLAASSADLARRVGRTGRHRSALLGTYAAWCTFAAALTADIARRNPRRNTRRRR